MFRSRHHEGMKSTTKILTVGISSVVGFGTAWLVATFIKSERRLEERRVELRAQLDLKAKGLRRLNFPDLRIRR